MNDAEKKPIRPGQHQEKPGLESEMTPTPDDQPKSEACDKLKDKVALLTGGDSGIGAATAILFAKEGADIAIAYLSETEDAERTKAEIEKYGRKCLLIKGDLGSEEQCKNVITKTTDFFGSLNILVNNAGNHWEAEDIAEITTEQLMTTFHSNFFSVFWLTKYAVPHLKNGDCIINTTSVTAYRGSGHLMDYAATKGAILAFTRSLSANLAEKGIRVNGVAPGPIWTPLIASTFPEEKVAEFGSDTPMKRAGEPNEVATCFLFLASTDSSYMTGQVLHPNGGEVVNA